MLRLIRRLLMALGIMTIVCMIVYWAAGVGHMPWYINSVIAIVATITALAIEERNK